MRYSNTSVTCKAPINIAVIKYWGKVDEKFNLPLNSSLSVTLNPVDLCTTTTVTLDASYTEDELYLNGKKEDITKNKRMQNCLQEARRMALKRQASDKDNTHLQHNCHIESHNNFPTAAGLASSASGYACLAKCLGQLYELDIDLSTLARLGSGSACRSMHGGFVKWMKGNSPSNSCAVQIEDENWWVEMKILILVTSNKEKSVPSTEGMRRSVQTSELLKFRSENIVDKRMAEMEDAILNKDFSSFAKITMQDSNQFHAICQDTYPPINPPYMNDVSHKIVGMVTEYNKKEIKAAYTFDAGPNAVLFTLEENFNEFLATILTYFPSDDLLSTSFSNISPELLGSLSGKNVELPGMMVFRNGIKRIISTRLGPGASVISNNFDH